MIESSRVQGPAIMGLIRPTLILPERVHAQFSDSELRFIFLHELAHLKRGDLAVQWLIAVLQILHWFNPVLWYSFRRMRADREPATDALVLSRAGETEKENYGLVLVKLLEHFHERHSLPTLVGILEDKEQFKHRFSLIGKFTRGAYGWSLLGVIIIAALAVAGLTRSGHAAFKRDPALPYAIDLKPFDSMIFHDPAGADSQYRGYSGHKVIDGLPFDIDGQVELYGKENADRDKNYPDAVSGIKIVRKFDELHLVHAVEWREYYGCPVAIVRLHYTEGSTVDLPIRFDFQVNDWNRLYTEDAEIVADPDTKIIWRGAGAAEGTGRLFKSVLHNPFPDRKVDTMEIVSTHSGCSYVLVAATVAQSDPNREVTAPLPFLPARHFLGHLTVRVVDKKTGAPLAGAEIYPAMVTGDISLVADNLLTSSDGTAVVNYPTGAEIVPAGSGDASDPKYPKGGAKDLRLKVTKAGYVNCEINWENGWDAAEMPEEITYRLTPVGDTSLNGIPDSTIKPSEHPTLLAAVKQGDAVGLQKLIDQGVDPSKVDYRGEPLIFAAGSPAVAEILLQHGANANARNKQNTPLINFICRSRGNGAAGIVGVLLAHGADPNSREGEIGETPLMDAQDSATVDVLVAHGADVKAKLTDGTGIMVMVMNHKPDYLDALIRHGVPFDPKTDGPTILVHAAWDGNVALIQAVLDRGVDPNLPGLWSMWHGKPDMMKPMMAAVVEGHLDVAKLFLEHGAKADNAMDTALMNRQAKIIKFLWEQGVRTISELAYDASQNAPAGDMAKLLDAGMPVDPPQDTTFSPLGIAAQLGEMDAVKLLVERGAAVNKSPIHRPSDESISSTSPLTMAASEGQDEVVEYLLAHGAVPMPSALWDAAENSTPYPNQRPKEHFETCVRLLLDAGALKNATSEEEGYILSSALGTRQGPPNATVLEMLLAAGISPEVPMPYLVKNGEKPNTVIGYYSDWYQKIKDKPDYGSMGTRFKPVLDMLEAADKGTASNKPGNP
jgi:ankyrin repeat protein